MEKRLHQVDSRSMLVHTPAYASWFNRVETSLSIIQPKVLRPNDFADLEAVRLRLALYEELSNQHQPPFSGSLTAPNWVALLAKIDAHQSCLAAAQLNRIGDAAQPDHHF